MMRKRGSKHPKMPAKARNIFADPTKRMAERRKHMLDQFKNFNAEAADLDELVEVASFGRQFRAEHEALNVPIPEYVDDNLRVIRREIDGRLADKRAARVRELKAQPGERREAIDRELAALGETVGV
jgi:hypothetical protein